MPFTDEKIDALNAEENAYPLEFFQKFAQAVTVYEDDDIWVVDKPAGLLSVDGKMLKVSLLARLERANPAVKLIHRLDMDTSGLLIFAKNSAAQTHISKQFIERLPQKAIKRVSLVNGKALVLKGRYQCQYVTSRKPNRVISSILIGQSMH